MTKYTIKNKSDAMKPKRVSYQGTKPFNIGQFVLSFINETKLLIALHVHKKLNGQR